MELLERSFRKVQQLISLIPADMHIDTAEFKQFLAATVCCFNGDLVLELSPCETDPNDMIKRIVSKIIKRNEKHAISLGWQKPSDRNNGNGHEEIELFQPNSAAYILTSGNWRKLAKVLGDDGYMQLLYKCSIFTPLENGCYLQLCGPLFQNLSSDSCYQHESVVTAMNAKKRPYSENLYDVGPHKKLKADIHSPFGTKSNSVCINWTFMLYGRPVYNQDRKMIPSLPANHPMVACTVDQIIKDIFMWEYLGRHSSFPELSVSVSQKRIERLIPVQDLIHKYCPIDKLDLKNMEPKKDIVGFQTPIEQVIGFIRAVVRNVVPVEMFGSLTNINMFLKNIDKLVKIRKFESLNLNMLTDSVKIKQIQWVKISNSAQVPPTESIKRKHLFNEWILWLAQRLIIPILSSTFYATETSVHRNLIVYFRHRVWMNINQPIYKDLTKSVFTMISTEELGALRQAANLPKVRLLPKNRGARPIINLGKKYIENGKLTSTNALLKPAFNALTYEMEQDRNLIGSSVSCKQDIYMALKNYKVRLLQNHSGIIPKLYFAKVDIQACFDSINQDLLLYLIEAVIKDSEYTISKYSTVQIVTGRIRKKFQSTAKNEFGNFHQFAKVLAKELSDCVIVDQVIQTFKSGSELVDLLESHIKKNVIRIGKNYFRQVTGIPQGSIVSTALCNVYFGKFEKDELKTISADDNSLLLRYMDDFIYISTSLLLSREFLRIVNVKRPDIGFSVNEDKTLTNFEYFVDGVRVQQVEEHGLKKFGLNLFPWCGQLIDMQQLDVLLDYGRFKITGLSLWLTIEIENSISVEFTNSPGRSLESKTLNCLKQRMIDLYIDPILNRRSTIILNIYKSFEFCAQKFVASIKQVFPVHATINMKFVTDIIFKLFHFQQSFCKSRFAHFQISAPLSKSDIYAIGAKAFISVLNSKQPKYDIVVKQLNLVSSNLPSIAEFINAARK